MNAANPYTKQYMNQSIETASREQLLIMLYDGAIKFLKIARKAMAEGNRELANTHFIKTQAIITEFMSTLDVAIGGDTARGLFDLYEYLYYQLVQANMRQDDSLAAEVQEHLVDLRRTWAEAIRVASKEKQSNGTLSGAGMQA